MRIYLDHNATTPLRREAREAMIAALDLAGNPSSVHAEGRAAKAAVETARAQVAEAVGCKPAEVVFTAGATEAASMLGVHRAGHDVLVDETAHDALWAHTRMVDGAERPFGPGHTFAMGLANGETGIVTDPPEKIDGRWPVPFPGGTARAERLLLDITQALGRVPFSFAWSGADFAVLSGHKIGGPKGVGALIVRDGVDIDPLSLGGGQEMGRRSGTENVAAIAGFGAACTAALADLAAGRWDEVARLRDLMEAAIAERHSDTIFVGHDATRLPNTSCVLSPGWKGETQVMAMDLAGYAISAGSACSSGKVRESRVLRAMGFDATQAASAVRVSLGLHTTKEEVMGFARTWTDRRDRHRDRAA